MTAVLLHAREAAVRSRRLDRVLDPARGGDRC